MASAFAGGFAKTLLGNLQADDQEKRLAERERLAAQLKKEYESQLIDSAQTRIAGNQEIRYNKFGDEIGRRELSAEELEARRAELDKTKADTERSLAEANMSRTNAEYLPQKLQLDTEQTRAQIESSRASAASSRASADNARGRLALDQERFETDLSNRDQALVDEAEQLLYAVGETDDVSMQAVADAQRAKLEAAKASGDKQELRAVINSIKGQLGLRYLRAKTEATSTNAANPYTLDGSGIPGPGGN